MVTINAAAANHPIPMVEAARLIGVVVIVSGLPAAASKAPVDLKGRTFGLGYSGSVPCAAHCGTVINA
jgi:hypothetical protein